MEKKQQIDHIIDTLFYGQLFLDAIENLSDKVFFKQKLKHLGKSFISEMESITNSITRMLKIKTILNILQTYLISITIY